MMSGKFVIYGQSRSGSTLLVELINTHPDVHCDGELFNEEAGRIGNSALSKLVKMFPIPYLSYLRRRVARKAYGFKLLFYHLPRARLTMKVMAFSGWKFIHVYRRNIARQSLSNIIAERTQRWHRRGDDASPANRIVVSVAQLQREIAIRDRWRSREMDLIKHIRHLDVCYEDDLEHEGNWTSTAEMLSRFLGLGPFEPRSISLKKTVDRGYGELIENYAELLPYLEAHDVQSRCANAEEMLPSSELVEPISARTNNR